MLPWWPGAIMRPVIQPLKGLWFAMHFNFAFDVFFEGKWISNMHLPRYYVAKMFLLSLPEFYFILLAAGAVIAVSALRRLPGASQPARSDWFRMAVVVAITLLPVAYTVVMRPVEYDGIRHYLFVVPLLAVVCGCTAAHIFERSGLQAWMIGGAVAASMVVTGYDLRSLHPHQYVYFNRAFAGGIATAAKSYETDYWGNSYKEGVEWLASQYAPRSPQSKIKVASCSYSLSTSYFLPTDRFRFVGSYEKGEMISEEPDVVLATTRWNCHNRMEGRVIHIVERQGAPLLYIKELHPVNHAVLSPVSEQH
jgi:hypothetical protein